jgi:hypothetical protein
MYRYFSTYDEVVTRGDHYKLETGNILSGSTLNAPTCQPLLLHSMVQGRVSAVPRSGMAAQKLQLAATSQHFERILDYISPARKKIKLQKSKYKQTPAIPALRRITHLRQPELRTENLS